MTSYKVQFSNDTHTWQPCRNGTEEAVGTGGGGREQSPPCAPAQLRLPAQSEGSAELTARAGAVLGSGAVAFGLPSRRASSSASPPAQRLLVLAAHPRGGAGSTGGDAHGCAQGPMARRSVPEGEHGSLVLGCTCESWAAVGTWGCGQGGCKQPPRGGAGMGDKRGLPQRGWGPGAVPCQQRLWGPHARSSLGSPCQEQFGVPTLTLVPVPGVPLWGGGRAVRVPQAPWLCPKSGPPPRCRCWAQPSATCPLFIRGWRGARGGRGWEAARP